MQKAALLSIISPETLVPFPLPLLYFDLRCSNNRPALSDVQFSIEDPELPGEPLKASLIAVGDSVPEPEGGEHECNVTFVVQGQKIRYAIIQSFSAFLTSCLDFSVQSQQDYIVFAL